MATMPTPIRRYRKDSRRHSGHLLNLKYIYQQNKKVCPLLDL